MPVPNNIPIPGLATDNVDFSEKSNVDQIDLESEINRLDIKPENDVKINDGILGVFTKL